MRPACTVSVTVTFVAVDGPPFFTVMVKTTSVPAVTVRSPVFRTNTSASATIVVESVALLLPATGSVVPAGAVTVAVLVSVPVAVAATVPVAVKVADDPAARFTVVAMLPVPDGAPQLAPGPALHVQLTPPRSPGKLSATVAPVTPDGPALVTVIVYVAGSPARPVVRPSVLVIERSALRLAVPEALAESLPGFGSVTPPGALVAVFVKGPGCVTSAVSDSTADWLAARSPIVHVGAV